MELKPKLVYQIVNITHTTSKSLLDLEHYFYHSQYSKIKTDALQQSVSRVCDVQIIWSSHLKHVPKLLDEVLIPALPGNISTTSNITFILYECFA